MYSSERRSLYESKTMNVEIERSYPSPVSNSPLLPYLLLSLIRQKHTPRTSNSFRDEYDYIVVGGGAAGAIVASRLSEESLVSVSLLEAGHEPPVLTEVPALYTSYLGSDVDWKFKTVPQKYGAYGFVNRTVSLASGKMLGGSANHNYMVYVRGNKKNYDDWAAQGAKGWSYREVRPYFLKLEDYRGWADNKYHAVGGPITVEKPVDTAEVTRAAREAVTLLGYEFVDSNAEWQTGFYDPDRNMRDGQRCSSLKGYLVPAENRPNLDIVSNAMVTKVVIENYRAIGVMVYHGGQFKFVRARREVILSAGAVNSPKILMLSGIGPREVLQKLNIPVIADLAVGKNLQDHPSSQYFVALDPRTPGKDESLADPVNILQYISNRSGPLSGSIVLTAFLKSQEVIPAVDFPDLQLILEDLSDAYVKRDLKPEVYAKVVAPYEDMPKFQCVSVQLQPKSSGTVTLRSSDPLDPPLIDPKYLKHPSDVEVLVEGLKVCKKLFDTPPLRKIGARPFETLVPGCERHEGSEHDYWKCYARNIVTTSYHYVGTCKMGARADPTTVVDQRLRVKNVRGLRVVDASVMPIIPSGNTNVPTMMIAEKASDMIKEDLYRWKRSYPFIQASTKQVVFSQEGGLN